MLGFLFESVNLTLKYRMNKTGLFLVCRPYNSSPHPSFKVNKIKVNFFLLLNFKRFDFEIWIIKALKLLKDSNKAKSNNTVVVLEPKTNTLLNGPNAPTQASLQVSPGFIFIINIKNFSWTFFCQNWFRDLDYIIKLNVFLSGLVIWPC